MIPVLTQWILPNVFWYSGTDAQTVNQSESDKSDKSPLHVELPIPFI